jgi:hypothetical protein
MKLREKWDSRKVGLKKPDSNKKGASRGFRSRLFGYRSYFYNSKLEGVNPPNFEIYISIRISSLEENGRVRGLDNFSALERFRVFRDLGSLKTALRRVSMTHNEHIREF